MLSPIFSTVSGKTIPDRNRKSAPGKARGALMFPNYSGSVCTTPRMQSTETRIPSLRRRVASTAPTITGLSSVSPTVAVWQSALASSLMTAAARRI